MTDIPSDNDVEMTGAESTKPETEALLVNGKFANTIIRDYGGSNIDRNQGKPGYIG